MGIMATVRVNTSQRMIMYRDFTIQESDDIWMWTLPGTFTGGLCPTPFKCIEAVETWYAREHDLTIPGERP
jgi:hypothetical protein